MAMRNNLSSKKVCSKCDKGAGAFSCDGCQQSFCLKHVAEHRQELISQMDAIEQEHDVFHEDLLNEIEKQNQHFLFNRINQWEKDSINKIQQTAEESRTSLKQILDNIVDHGQKSLNKISLKLRRAREFDDFFENDLARWTDQLSHLRTELQYMSNNIDIINDNSTSVIKFIKIIPDKTTEHSDTNWSNRFSWLSNVKTLFYDRSKKSSLTDDNETKNYSTQTRTEGSIMISKVNNIDHYIDIENDNCTEKDQNMTGWTLQRDVGKNSKIIYKFPDNFTLKSRSTVRILCGNKTNIEEQEKQILINEDTKSWDNNSHICTYLIDANGEEKASIFQTLLPL